MAFWRATDVDLPQNSAIVTVNTGDDVGNITTGYIIQINTQQFLEVKTVNTGASPQTIELYQIYTGTAITGGTAIAAPTQGAIKEATEELRSLRTTYESLADSVSATATANSVAQRNANSQLLIADATADNHAMAFGQYTDPTDYGIGVRKGTAEDNLDATDITGYGQLGWWNTASSINVFDGLTSSFGGFVNIPVASSTKAQIGIDNTGDMFTQYGSQDARLIYDSGNSVNPIDYGIGTEGGSPTIDDTDNIIAGGLYRTTSATLNRATGITTGTLFVLKSYNVVTQIHTNGPTNIYIRRSTDTGATWGGWFQMYTEANINLNTFGANGANDVIATGFAISSTSCRFYFPLSMNTNPNSISVAGTFEIQSSSLGSLGLTGISAITLHGNSSFKTGVVQVTGLTGLTGGAALHLRAESSASEITFS